MRKWKRIDGSSNVKALLVFELLASIGYEKSVYDDNLKSLKPLAIPNTANFKKGTYTNRGTAA